MYSRFAASTKRLVTDLKMMARGCGLECIPVPGTVRSERQISFSLVHWLGSYPKRGLESRYTSPHRDLSVFMS